MRGLRSHGAESDAPRRSPRGGDDGPAVSLEPDELETLLATPSWLRSLGTSAWFAVGITLFVIGTVWLLSLTQTIVMPVITAAVVAAVASPLVSALARRGVGRGGASALLIVGAVVLAAAIVGIILAGIGSQLDGLRDALREARTTLAGYAADLGIDRDTAEAASSDAANAVGDFVPALLGGLTAGLSTLSSLAFFLALTLLSLFFLLMDGPQIRRWAERHMWVPEPAAHAVTGRVLQSLRGYFVGVTFVALFNAAVVLVGALLLGVPLAGTIALVTFLGAYVPYLGAWGAGAFAVLIALGGAGPGAALGMIVVQLLANGILQQLVQPIAMGAALGIHPLAVLIVTIAGGSLFGAVGLILAGPLTAAATRIAGDLARRRAEAAERIPDAPTPVGA